MADNKPELQRGLEARHIELIAPGHHWRRPVYGGRQYPEMGRAIRIVGLYHRRAVRLFIMRSMGEMLFLEPVTGSFAVYAHRYMSPFLVISPPGLTGLCGWRWGSQKSPPLAFMSSSGSRRWRSGYPH